MAKRRTISVALIGTKFMGRAHSNAWRQAPRFFALPAEVRMAVMCGRDLTYTRRAAKNLGWETATDDWRAAVANPLIDVVDICTPNNLHARIAIAAAQAGKAIVCEKPLSRNTPEAERMVAAVKHARVANMVCHNYRRLPAIALAKQMVLQGDLGRRIYHFHARYAQDWIADERFPFVWRLQKKLAGSGALGDIGAHIIDMARYFAGEIESVCAITETFVKRRPAAEGGRGSSKVDVDDAVSVIGRFRSGTILNLEATRFAHGRKNQLAFEINGSGGSLVFDLEDMNRLRFYAASDPEQARGFRDILVTEPSHPYSGNWWPPGHVIGYEHSFTHTIADFLQALIGGKRADPDFADGLETQRVIEAIARSAKARRMVRL